MNDSPDVNTKTALLAAAIEVFADKGFDSATVRDICSRAKANVAAVNYHFGSKDGLYASVLEEIFPKGEEWQARKTSAISTRERLHNFLHGLASEIYEPTGNLVAQKWAIFLREMAKPSHNLDIIVQHQVQPRANELRQILSDILGPTVPDHALAFCSSNIWAMMLDHLLTQPILDRLNPHRPNLKTSMDQFVDHVVIFCLGGLEAIKNNT
ncbi:MULTISPECIES: TetR/AcrR family transcriptional regulator [unclassified Pseudodesulfovibrio]|uniref:TetR/AcrR family transcriptional regulator n=1 Tax=unclassified Pseudodesulfovibrio TaxID=2661612 RepID=UPI000FEBA386|nr:MULTISPECIES: TetR/AcrR family transcriptional regulator [unclassified Pseudodesulfovibrio]MCJ2164497.1 TetR/AcrR family transcriptional regulator [Pseudodesulfovibrio sp. S3-i]RWU04695.1 TetR/AcrR family transcriptional regulator [Pseudodesulfovibrio sp. S3]